MLIQLIVTSLSKETHLWLDSYQSSNWTEWTDAIITQIRIITHIKCIYVDVAFSLTNVRATMWCIDSNISLLLDHSYCCYKIYVREATSKVSAVERCWESVIRCDRLGLLLPSVHPQSSHTGCYCMFDMMS